MDSFVSIQINFHALSLSGYLFNPNTGEDFQPGDNIFEHVCDDSVIFANHTFENTIDPYRKSENNLFLIQTNGDGQWAPLPFVLMANERVIPRNLAERSNKVLSRP